MLIFLLKLIGIILLCVIGLILVLLLLVLLAPIRYYAECEYDKENLKLNVRVTWLAIFRVYFNLIQKDVSYRVKIFFFNIINSEKEKKTPKKVKANKEKTAAKTVKQSEQKAAATKTDDVTESEDVREADDVTEAESVTEIESIAEAGRVAETTVNVEKTAEQAENHAQGHTEQHSKQSSADSAMKDTGKASSDAADAAGATKKAKKKFHFRLLHPAEVFDIIITKILDICDIISKKLQKAIGSIDKICDMITSPENREMVVFILNEVKKLFKHIKPRKHGIYVKEGLADPALTGQVLGAYSVLNNILALNFVLEPDFDNEVLEVRAYMKGRIRVLNLLIIGIRLYSNKTLRKLIRRK